MLLRQSRPPLLTELHIVAVAWGLGFRVFRAEVQGLGLRLEGVWYVGI